MRARVPVTIALLVIAVLPFATPVFALFIPTNMQAATLVLGQPDFVSSSFGTSQTNMKEPQDVAVDPTTGKVFVSEHWNHRVLRFANVSALQNGAAAEAVLGEPDFTSVAANLTQNGFDSPFGLTVDASGRLWVADSEHDRVLRFDNASTKANGANADGVLGQADFTTVTEATSQ